MTGKTANSPLQTSPRVAAAPVTASVNSPPVIIRYGRSFRLALGVVEGRLCGSSRGAKTRDSPATVSAICGNGGNAAKPTAAISQAESAQPRAAGQAHLTLAQQ